MNTDQQAAAAAAATQPHRLSTSCDRHPDESFSGFCPSCLFERLSVLDQNSSPAASSSSSRKPPISAAAFKALFKPSSSNAGASSNSNSRARTSFFPELRRSKSFSASKNEGFSGVFEPQRRSCDVRARNTLSYLFNQDGNERNRYGKDTRGQNSGEIDVQGRNSSVKSPVIESKEEDEIDSENERDYVSGSNGGGESGMLDRIRNVARESVQEIVEVEDENQQVEVEVEVDGDGDGEEEMKRIKDHIDLESQTKKPSGRDFKEIAGSFWSAASMFSKKLQKWRQKQKLKKQRRGGGSSATLPVEKSIGRQFMETQSEIADYGFGRRSCDTDPRFSLDAGRFSLDAGRISFDDPRYSFEEPRASCDGYLMGRAFQRMPTIEDAPIPVPQPVPATIPVPVQVVRTDTQIPVEEEATTPGGSAQTRDYYSDSSSKRKKSLDRSSSIRKTAAAVVAEMDELRSVSNPKASPEVLGPKIHVEDRESMFSYSNSLKDDFSAENLDRGARKSRRWSKGWNIWAFINKRSVNNNKYEEDEQCRRGNGVERCLSESWQERNGEARNNPKVLRSNSSVSWRSSSSFNGSIKKNNPEMNVSGRKKKEDFGMERNRSARFSPNRIDNGMLRLYLTPGWRGGWGKTRPNHAQSIAKNVVRFY